MRSKKPARGQEKTIKRLTREQIKQIADETAQNGPDPFTVCTALRLDAEALSDMMTRGARHGADPLDSFANEEITVALAKFEKNLFTQWKSGGAGSQAAQQILQTITRKYDRLYRERIDAELHNIFDAVGRHADEGTLLRILDDLRTQDPEAIGHFMARKQLVSGSPRNDSDGVTHGYHGLTSPSYDADLLLEAGDDDE